MCGSSMFVSLAVLALCLVLAGTVSQATQGIVDVKWETERSSELASRSMSTFNIDVRTLSSVVAGAVSQAIQQQQQQSGSHQSPFNSVMPANNISSTTVATVPGASTTPVVATAGSSARLVKFLVCLSVLGGGGGGCSIVLTFRY